MTPEQIIEVQRNLAWDALDKRDTELAIAKSEIGRLRTALSASQKTSATLKAEIEQLQRQVVIQ